MYRKFKQIILPIFVGSLAVMGLFASALTFAQTTYREQHNQQITALISQITTHYPDIPPETIIDLLNNKIDPNDVAAGNTLLQQFGYLAQDDYDESAAQFSQAIIKLTILALLSLAGILTAYFLILDYLRQKQLKNLVNYLQDLDQQIHDLRLNQNSEDSLSLLTNELYKIVVSLKTVAKLNQDGRQHLEQALADISHQLRTPLTSLQITIDNLYHHPEMSPETRQAFLQTTSRQLTQISYLITTLLNLARFDNKSIKLYPCRTTLRELLSQVEQNLAVLADLHNIKLVVSGDLDAPAALDLRWQVEALTNIVKNCIEHSPAGSEVTLKAKNSPLFWQIIIQDSGEGIARDDLRHIFERFYKAKNSNRDSIGIGLAFAKAIINAENGQISVSSTIGQGTTFKIQYLKAPK